MKKTLHTIISTLLCLSLLCAPVANVRAAYALWTMAEDLTGYTSAGDLQEGWTTPRTGDTAEIGVDSANGGYGIVQTAPKYLTDSNAANGTFSPSIQRVFNVHVQDEANRTVLKSRKLQGIYELTISYSAKVLSKSSHDGVKLNPSYYAMYIGAVNTDTNEIDSASSAVNVRFNAGKVDITNHPSSSQNTMSVKSIDYAEPDAEEHTVQITVNTVDQRVSVVLDGDTEHISEGAFMRSIDSLDGMCLMAMERMEEGSFFRIRKIELKELESEAAAAVKNVLNSLPDKLADDPSNVTADLTLPELNGVTWSSSDPAVISAGGAVTRQSSDSEVELTAVVDLGSHGGIYEKTYSMTVPALEGSEPPDEPGVDGSLISFEEDFTQYTAFNDIPRWGQTTCDLTSVTATQANGIEIMQTDTQPLVNGAVNGAQSTKLTHVIEGVIKSDEASRTQLRINKFAGQFKFILDFEVYCPAVGEVDGVRVTQPYYNVIAGQAPDVSNPSSVSNNGIFMRLRTNDMTVLNASSTSGNSMSPTGLTYDTGKTTHQAEISFDTENKTAAVTVDGAAGAASTGPLLSADYLNAFSFSAMDRMKIGSYLRIKKIKVQQTAQNDRVTAALSALEGLPATLAADPYAVAADLTLPEHEFITWTTSDSSVIDENGKVHRWFNDRDVVLTATYNDGGLCILKDYTMTVKALDGSSRQLLNETVTSDAGWAFENLLSSASGAYAVTPDGLEITKTTGAETETPAYEAKAYAADYRMFGLAEAYSSESAAVYSSGYCGVYDVSFQLKSQVAGNAPVYAEIGRQNGAAFSEALGLHVTKNGIDAVYISDQGEERTPVFSGSTYGKTFDVTLRIDTVRKQGWIFVDGSLATTALQLDSARDSYRIDTLRLALDLNNALYDSISVNHIRLEEWEYSEVPSKNALLSALDLLHIDDIVDNPDAVSTVHLPESANGTSLVWSCSSGLIDVDTGEVFHDESAADVVLCATVCSAESVYARKQFPLTVRQAESDEELIAYKLSQLGRSITAQNKEDLRYDLYLPTSYEGMQVQWTSSDETVIGANGAINRETAVTSPTAVSLTAQASLNGKSVQKTFDFVVSPYAYTYTIYSGASIPERFASDIKISRDTVTSLVFGANCTGRADIAFVDSSGKEAIKLVFDGNSYSFEYGGGATASYAAGGREAVDVMIMPDIDKVAVWRNGEILLDWCPAKDDIADFSGFSVSGDAVSMEQVTVKTDEYGVLDINKDHIDYFKPLEGNVLEGSVSLVTDTVLPAEVAWISSDPSVISSTGLVNTPSAYRFVNLSLQLTSLRDSSVLRTYSKTVAVACDSSRNIAAGAAAAVSTLEKDGFPITNLTDNDKTTVFGASGAGKQPEIELDFGTERHINSLYLNENFDSYDKGIESYELYCSGDGETWTAVKAGAVTDLQSNLIAFNTVYTRYLKFKITACASSEVYINELEAYLFADAEELVRLDIDTVKLDAGYGVESDLVLPSEGMYGTPFTWASDRPDILSSDGKLTRPERGTTVTLTVSATCNGRVYSKDFSLYVPGSSASGGTGGGSGAGAGWSGPGEQIAPGFVPTDSAEASQDPQPAEEAQAFGDVDTAHWAYDAINSLKTAGIVNGDENGFFNPASQVTREEFLKMLVAAAGIDTAVDAAAPDFDDVEAGSWYAPYVAAGVREKIIEGISDTEFGTGRNISRQDMAVMVMRMLPAHMEIEDEKVLFEDDGQIAAYAYDAVYAARSLGLVEGYENRFQPAASLTRAEAAVVVSKLMAFIE